MLDNNIQAGQFFYAQKLFGSVKLIYLTNKEENEEEKYRKNKQKNEIKILNNDKVQ